ncbi:transcription factor bHLH123-like isoform X1 [Phoenix dactylifera]|uniref:Transcription factor bHLH123-like isoform X1 n=1 Tax=Phoenix dactylifera TaxID=42345 RepID=A0A8B8ZIR2_PHODC|nr:transcription factor bHLH123-like isoform X1 [Phoenix dactylifera]
MGEDTHGGGWMTEMQQWFNLPENVPMISTYSPTSLEFNDPLRSWSNQNFGPSSSQTSNWFAEAAPLHPIKEEGHQQDSEEPLESFSEVPSSLLKNTGGGRCPPFPVLNQSSHMVSYDNSRRRKTSPDSCCIYSGRKCSEIPITSHVAPLKVRKEKLGDRITMLQQLVSPFGKTDTASVLLDATEYIKCHHEQLTVLCAPYVKMVDSCSNISAHAFQSYEIKKEMEGKEDLRSRGLCLVPISTICNAGRDASINSWAPKSGTIYR